MQAQSGNGSPTAQLALHGGKPTLGDLRPYLSISQDETERVIEVLRSGCLSGFYGSWGDQYHGGPRVREFESAWANRFGVRHAVSVNSATSGLFAALGAIGISPGDEVIVPPTTMSATVMAPLVYGGIPVFADIEPETFTLDPDAVRAALSPRTRAILAVNLFGHPARLTELRELADRRGLHLIEDNAQGPLAREGDRYAGTIGHIGVFSLNYHKHIHTGEGGVCVTDDDGLAQRLAMIRNHAENVVEPLAIQDLTNLIGFNYRMTELNAAVGLAQLAEAERHIGRAERIGCTLTEGIRGLTGLTPPVVRSGCRHVYYVWAMRYDENAVGVSRQRFSEALAAEGFPHFTGYVRPLYLLPVFQKRMAIGRHGFPFTLSDVRYEKGMCPVAERMYHSEFVGFECCAYAVDDETAQRLVQAIRKVHAGRSELVERRAA